ncbi:monocarboxylate transporter 13-like [Dermacentor andersoni]|uniref:monocarboxylate transporter 13-like n=1 Tax=Dermacentor andersoni TaxID=34620 RepID=UPI003B3A15E9
MTGHYASSTSVETERRRSLLDRCWSVPFGVALSAFLLVMVSSCYGYLSVLFREKYGVSHERVSWLASTLVIAQSSSGLLVSQLQHRISVYHISLMGSCLASAGLVASAFAPDIAWMTFTLGIMYGTGIGSALLGLCLYLLLYFDEYRGTATAIMWILRATSGMAGMPLLWHLTGTYGIQGCLLVMGGLVLHCVPMIMLIQSPRPCRLFFQKAVNKSTVYATDYKNVESPGKTIATAVSSTDCEWPESAVREEKAPTSRLRIALTSFTSMPFYVLVIQSVISEYVFVSFTVTIVAHAVDKGLELHQGNQVVVFSAVGLLIGRTIMPFATDKIRFSRCPTSALCYLVAAVCMLLLVWIQSFGGMILLTVVMGVAQGYILCIKTVLIADYVGVSGVSFCCGVGGLVTIPVWLCGPAVIGFFRDTKGSYDLLYVTFAALCFFVATLLAYLTCSDVAQRKRRRKQCLGDDGSAEMTPMNKDLITSTLKECIDC